MDLSVTNAQLEKIRKSFVVSNPVTREPVDMSLFRGKFVIYCIQDLTNNLKYIGSTINFSNRVGRYLYEYSNKVQTNQKIVRIMRKKSIENFIIFPIDVSINRLDLRQKEREYILRYQTNDPNIGYNDVLPPIHDRIKNYPGHAHTAKTKAGKAKFIAAVNNETKEMYISEGMKLFADITNSTKDLVKNEAKNCVRHRGFYIIYLNSTDRTALYDRTFDRYMDVVNDVYPTGEKRGRNRARFGEYIAAADMVIELLETESAQVFFDAGYKCHYLHYDLSNQKPYLIDPIDTFFDTIDITSFDLN